MQTFKKSFVLTSVKIQKSIFLRLYGLLHNHMLYFYILLFSPFSSYDALAVDRLNMCDIDFLFFAH